MGAAEGVVDQAAERLRKQFPGINIVGCYSPTYGFENNENEIQSILSMLSEKKPDILLVGVGAPKQEKWIYKYYAKYNIPVSIGVGATFDFIAGNVKRAPAIMQKYGMEWLWRLCQEPKRLWRRYLVEDARFFKLVLQELLQR